MKDRSVQLSTMRAIVEEFRARSGESFEDIREFADRLNDLPGVSPVTFQAVDSWARGLKLPSPERARLNYLIAPRWSWQRRFWESVALLYDPADVLIGYSATADGSIGLGVKR